MTKKKLVPLIVVAILLVAVVAVGVIISRDPVADPFASSASSSVVDSIPVLGGETTKFVKQITITNENGTFDILNKSEKTDNQQPAYAISQLPENAPLNTGAITSCMAGAATLTAKRIVTTDDFEPYGLLNPTAVVNIQYDEGVAGISIGNDAPGGEGTYVSKRDDKNVYLVSTNTITAYRGKMLDFVNLTLFPVSAEQAAGFDTIKLSGKAYPQPIKIKAVPELAQEAGGMSFNTHQLTAPIRAGVDSETGLAPFMALYGLTATRAVAVVTDAGELLNYDLLEPYINLVAASSVAGYGEIALSLSNKQNDGSYFANIDGSPIVYSLSPETVPWAGLTTFDIINKMAILPFIDDVATVTVQSATTTLEFTLAGEGDTLKVSLAGNEIDTGNFKQFYQTLIAASYSETTSELPTEDATLKYTYKYKDSSISPDVVEFYPLDARRMFIVLNGGTPYLAKSTYVDRVLADMAKIAAGQEVKSYF